MTDHDFRKRMTVADHLTERFDPDTTQKIKELVVYEYLKGKNAIHRLIFEKIQPFLHISKYRTFEDRIRLDEEAELKPLRDKFLAYGGTMVYLKAGDEFNPLFIMYREMEEVTLEDASEKDYIEFLDYFYFCVMPKTDENNFYYIHQKAWNHFKKVHKPFLDRLVAEDKAYYTEEGVFDIEKKVKFIKLRTNRRIDKLKEQEREKIVAFLLEGESEWIEVI